MTRRDSWLTWANAVTVLRGIATVPIVWLLIQGYQIAALIVFALAACTDFIDGYLARSRGEESTLGALLDPVADKVFGTAVLATLVYIGSLPLWMLMVLAAKELLLLFGGLLLLSGGKKVTKARPLGKYATVVLFAGIVAVISGFPGMDVLGYWVSTVGILLSVGAGIDYALVTKKQFTSAT